jgi:hypothetical protein
MVIGGGLVGFSVGRKLAFATSTACIPATNERRIIEMISAGAVLFCILMI